MSCAYSTGTNERRALVRNTGYCGSCMLESAVTANGASSDWTDVTAIFAMKDVRGHCWSEA